MSTSKSQSSGKLFLLIALAFLVVACLFLVAKLFGSDVSDKALEEHESRSKKQLSPFPKELRAAFFLQEKTWKSSGPIFDKDLIELADRQELHELALKIPEVGFQGYQRLQSEPLQSLRIENAHVDARSLEAISNIASLKDLFIKDFRQMDDAEFGHLKGPVSLEELQIRSTLITSASLRHIAQTFPSLERLNLDLNANLGEPAENFHQIARMHRLDSLYLDGCPITDACVKSLSLSTIRKLILPNTPITDEGLRYAASLKSLQMISIRGCKGVSKRAIERFCKQRPDCFVDTGPSL